MKNLPNCWMIRARHKLILFAALIDRTKTSQPAWQQPWSGRPVSGKTQLQTEGGRLTWLPLPAWPIENSATLTKEKQRMWARLVQLWKVLIRLNYWRQLSVMSSEGRDESGIIRCPATQITSRDHDNSSLLRTGHNLHYSIKYRVYLRVRAPSAKVYKILFKSIK